MTGLEVIEVNIAVNDIQIPGAEDSTEVLVAPVARARRVTVPHPSSTAAPAGLTTETRMNATRPVSLRV